MVVVFSLLALSFSTTYAASPAAFSDSDLLGILTLGGAVNGGALLAGAGRFAPWAANALLAVLAIVGIACSYAVHTDLILSSPVLLWALRKYMGLESTPFHDLSEVRFRRFENFFVNALYTTHSLQLPFALDERAYAILSGVTV